MIASNEDDFQPPSVQKSVVDIKMLDSVATLVINRPEVCNALDAACIDQLIEALGDVHQEKRIRSVIITGKGDHFCSGIDFKHFAEITQLEPPESHQAWYQQWSKLAELCETILRYPKPVIAAVNGSAIGSGLALALACDILVMSRSATLIANAAHRGLVGGVTAPLLAFRSSAAVAARMLLGGAEMDADEALQIGLAAEVVDNDQTWVAAGRWAETCGQVPRESAQASKRMLNETIGETLLTQLASGAASGAAICNTDAASEGINAFVEKRDPEWPK